MGLKITSITLQGFRAFHRLEISGMGRVNLITGKNNTGKSSLLEALRLLASNGSPSVIRSILNQREEFPDKRDDKEVLVEDAEKLFLTISSLFHRFPQLSGHPAPIGFETGGDRSMKLTLSLNWRTMRQESVPGLDEDDLALVADIGGKHPSTVMRLDEFHYRYNRPRHLRPDLNGQASLPCIYVSPYGGEGTASLGRLWDQVALSDQEQYVVQALQIIDPQISRVSMMADNYRRGSRTAIVRANNIPRPVPLRSFGDGMNRLFGIILSLVNAGGGLLLIDEFENGLHYTVQYDTWRIIFKLAQTMDIQVFATSHSRDAIEAFQKAAADTPEDGALIRLTRHEDDIIPTVFSEEELAVATRDRIEVR